MIGSIQGRVSESGLDWVILETPSGVGYLVSTPISTASTLPPDGNLRLVTHLVVREDQLTLYGFLTQGELRFFQQLISVSGVGPRMALSVLNAGKVEALQTAIVQNDTAILTTISGVGKKTAERIMVELKNKIDFAPSSSAPHSSEDLVDALTQLGYNAYEVRRVAMEIPGNLATTEERIKYALQLLSK